jgi:hypothetical protein
LVNDKNFHLLVQKTKHDEVPYFIEYDNSDDGRKSTESKISSLKDGNNSENQKPKKKINKNNDKDKNLHQSKT